MGIIGKIVGGTIGFALGGPLGAVAGAVFGHAFDNNPAHPKDAYYKGHLSSIEQTQLTFFVSTFSMLAKLSSADGKVSNAEVDTIDAFAVHELGLSPQSKEVAFNIFYAALNSPASFEDFANQFYHNFRNRPELVEMMVDILLRVSVADGSSSVAEKALIQNAVNIFGMSQSRYTQLKSQYAATSDHAYHTLGCQRDDTDEQIKKKYRQLVQAYHPDKIASQGLPDEFTQLAQEKFREIQTAFEAIKKERGMN